MPKVSPKRSHGGPQDVSKIDENRPRVAQAASWLTQAPNDQQLEGKMGCRNRETSIKMIPKAQKIVCFQRDFSKPGCPERFALAGFPV